MIFYKLVLINLSLFILFLGCNTDKSTSNTDNKNNINSLEDLSSLFKNPPNQYRSVPFWV